jgi:signal transduction histidine kinase
VRRRLLVSYLAVAAVVLALLAAPLAVSYAHNARQDLIDKVERDAVALATLVEDSLENGGPVPPQVRRVVSDYTAETGGRVIVVDDTGAKLVDTAPTGARDFTSRPEIATALDGEIAVGTRHSQTLGTDLVYVAVPVASNGVIHGAVRITYPMSAVNERIERYWAALALLAAIVLAVAATIAVVLSRWMTRSLDRVERAAEAIGGGNLDLRVPVEGPPEVRRLAQTFNGMVTQLAALMRSQDEFVADASHQLRTPLTALRLRLENLERDLGSAERGEVAGAIAEVERLASLVDALLVLARADRAPSTPEPIRLDRVVGERLEAWEAIAEDRGVELVEQLDPELAVLATPGRLEQVLDNLLANALEVQPAGTSIEVTGRRVNGSVEIHVRDRGPGMSAEEAARAFDRFWRAGSSEDGFGLGLAIVQRLVRADGGGIELAPRDGGGLDASVRLRAATTAPPAPAPRSR